MPTGKVSGARSDPRSLFPPRPTSPTSLQKPAARGGPKGRAQRAGPGGGPRGHPRQRRAETPGYYLIRIPPMGFLLAARWPGCDSRLGQIQGPVPSEPGRKRPRTSGEVKVSGARAMSPRRGGGHKSGAKGALWARGPQDRPWDQFTRPGRDSDSRIIRDEPVPGHAVWRRRLQNPPRACLSALITVRTPAGRHRPATGRGQQGGRGGPPN
jgi:hypothetical protein